MVISRTASTIVRLPARFPGETGFDGLSDALVIGMGGQQQFALFGHTIQPFLIGFPGEAFFALQQDIAGDFRH